MEWIRGPGDRGQGTGDRGQGTGDILTPFDSFGPILTIYMSKIPGTCFFRKKKAPAACCLSQENGWGGFWGIGGFGFRV